MVSLGGRLVLVSHDRLVVVNFIVSLFSVQNYRVKQHFVEVNDVLLDLLHPLVPFEVIVEYFQVLALQLGWDSLVVRDVLVHLHHHFVIVVFLREDLLSSPLRGIFNRNIVC